MNSSDHKMDDARSHFTPPQLGQLGPVIKRKGKLKRYSKWVNAYMDYLTYRDNPLTEPLTKPWIEEQIKSWDSLHIWQIESLHECNAPFPDLARRWISRMLELKAFVEKYGHARVKRNSRKDDDPLGKWVAWQRLRKEKLSEGQINILNKLDFVWDPLKKSWNDYYLQLQRFHAEHGHCRVPQCDTRRDPLAKWVARQRQKKNTLTPQQIKLMNDLGFSWKPLSEAWEKYFSKLEKFQNENGHCRVPVSTQENAELRNWVQRQRSAFHNGKLSEEKIDRLKSISFDFYCYEANFNKWLDELKTFYKEHGHVKVPYKNRSLSKWIQRTRNSKDKLPQSVIDELDAMHFVWQPKKEYWYKRFAQLKEFHDKYGVTAVPCDYDMSFSGWVRDQKKRKNSLDDEQIKLLDSLGYDWNQSGHLPKTYFKKRGIKPEKIELDTTKPNIFSVPKD